MTSAISLVQSGPAMTLTSEHGERVTIAFAGGGTGGHLTPGMAVAEALQSAHPDADVLFLGSGRPVEQELLCRTGFELRSLPSVSSPGSVAGLLRSLCVAPWGLFRAWRLLAKRQPDVLVALGGYAALLPAICASWRGIPIVVLEQNSLPGKVNRFVAERATDVIVQWQQSVEHFPDPDRVAVLGNPVRREVLGRDRATSCQEFGLDPAKTTVYVTGGSQGAVALNELIFAALPQLEGMADRVQVLHSVGDVGFEEARGRYADVKATVSYHRFIHDAGAAFACADLAVCRAGATTLAELTANGIPSILIPYPYAAEDHQYFNAKLLSDAGAAVVSRQSELTPQSFASLLVELLTDDHRREAMSKAAAALGLPKAAEVVADTVMRRALERRRLRGAL